MAHKHIDGVTVRSEFSECQKYRYTLSIEKTGSSGDEGLCVIMQNPSYASSENADKSVQFIEKLVFEKKYSEFKNVKKIIVVNQFAFIQTKDFVGSDNNIGTNNDKHIRETIQSCDLVLVAWGKSNNYDDRIATINTMIKDSGKSRLFQTKSHPSRGTYVNFVEKYII
jgi:hypothetical protein